jgi:hypothetical protein
MPDAPDTRTLREIHEGCKHRHRSVRRFDDYEQRELDVCDNCGVLHPCPEYTDAVAALDLLDEARMIEGRYYGNSPYIWFKDGERIRLTTDPERGAP